MKSLFTTSILISVLLSAACVPSLYPFYTDGDLTTDASLIGSWIDKETSETWTFSDRGGLKYTLVHLDPDGRRGEYDARLVKIEDKLFLDIVPVRSGFAQNDLYRDRFIATHTFVHVVRKDATLQISYMEPRWLKDHLAQKPDAIRHEKVGGEIVLTSSPQETQKFVLEHFTTRGAFSTPAEFARRQSGS